MKKMYLLIIFTFISGYSQEFKKSPKDFCKVNHTCRLEYKHDDFDNADWFKIGHYETGLSENKSLTYTLDKFGNNGKFMILMSFIAMKKGCRTRDSYVHIKFKDGTDLKLPTAYKGVNCGVSAIGIDITEHIESLKTKAIDKIRIHIEYDDDYEVYDKGQKKLFDNLNCIQQSTPF